jgi:hypothetical protein
MNKLNGWLTSVGVVVLAAPATAQFQMQGPQMRGIWNPVVGGGAAYQVEEKQNKQEMELAVVGTEDVAGKNGYWLEMSFKDVRRGQMVVEYLYVVDGNQIQLKKMIMQQPGQQPIEMPAGMWGAGRGTQAADFRHEAELIGQETITTPAGTFACQHYRLRDRSAESWVSDKVPPWGLVKATSQHSNMTLLRVISNAKTKVTGTPQKFDPTEMMRRQRP